MMSFKQHDQRGQWSYMKDQEAVLRDLGDKNDGSLAMSIINQEHEKQRMWVTGALG